MGKNRERETPKWSEQVLKFTLGLFGPQPAALNSTSEPLKHRHITQMASFIRLTESKLTQHVPLWRADIRDLSDQSEITSAFQSLRTSPSRQLFSILPFWAVRNNLGSFFINLGCQVVFDVSHISNLVLHHCRKRKSQVRVTKSVKTLRIQIKALLLKRWQLFLPRGMSADMLSVTVFDSGVALVKKFR